MRVVSLGSGSSGNALLVEAGPQGRTKLLVDAGLSVRTLAKRLQELGTELAQIRGILVTHEHSDHVSALPALLKYNTTPIIADRRTHQAIETSVKAGMWRSDSGKLVSTQMNELDVLPLEELPIGGQRMIGDIGVTSFATSHDAAAPCGYLLKAGGWRVCIVTDTGYVTPDMLAAMQQADLLILEANHDKERLLHGPYPWHLKKRILSQMGHLSNEQAAEAVWRIWRSDGIRWLWLAHLSRTNNTPELALQSVREYLLSAGANLHRCQIATLPPGMGHVWDSTQLW